MDQAIRDLFPAARKYAYLNSAAMAPVPTTAARAVAAQIDGVSNDGIAGFDDWQATRSRARNLAAEMLCVDPRDIAFVRNTSDGIAAVAAGLEWRSGDNIVSFVGEFPANFYPWRRAHDDAGVELRLCREIEGRVDVEELLTMIDGRTRVVALSAVQYASGFKIDLERIGRAARHHDALFYVDIIQAFGAMPLDLPSQFVDVASGGSYKWLCSPEGCGIFYANERARSRIKPHACGWMSVEDAWDFENRGQALKCDTSVWETGMIGSALFYGLEQSLDLIHCTGVDKIESHLTQLTDLLCEAIPHEKFTIFSSRSPGEKSQIVSLLPRNGTTSYQYAERLATQGVIVSARGPLLRIAPHFFNNIDDIERFVAAL